MKQHNFITFRHIQQNLAVKCIFYCLTVVQNLMQKSASTAKISTKVTGGLGYFFMFTLYNSQSFSAYIVILQHATTILVLISYPDQLSLANEWLGVLV